MIPRLIIRAFTPNLKSSHLRIENNTNYFLANAIACDISEHSQFEGYVENQSLNLNQNQNASTNSNNNAFPERKFTSDS